MRTEGVLVLSLGDSDVKGAWSGQGAITYDLIHAICQVGSEQG